MVSTSLPARIPSVGASEAMPSKCMVNTAGQIGLIIYRSCDLQGNAIYLVRALGKHFFFVVVRGGHVGVAFSALMRHITLHVEAQ